MAENKQGPPAAPEIDMSAIQNAEAANKKGVKAMSKEKSIIQSATRTIVFGVLAIVLLCDVSFDINKAEQSILKKVTDTYLMGKEAIKTVKRVL